MANVTKGPGDEVGCLSAFFLRISPSFDTRSVKFLRTSISMGCSSRTILFHIFGSAGSGFKKIRRRDTGYGGKQARDGGMKVPYCAPSKMDCVNHGCICVQ